MSIKTEFSDHAKYYAKYRPSYPIELFEFLKKISPKLDIAYDVGTGNGQAALMLSNYFKKVYASDLSIEQISNSTLKNNIEYFVSEAHLSKFNNSSIDLITIATAIHWFDIDNFFKEAKRILVPNGVIAFWSYGFHQCENEILNNVIQKTTHDVLGSYWSPQPKLVWDGYKSINLPFELISSPSFNSDVEWDLNEFLGYFSTWSASQKYIKEKGHHPMQEFMQEIHKCWKSSSEKIKFTTPLHLKVGRASAQI